MEGASGARTAAAGGTGRVVLRRPPLSSSSGASSPHTSVRSASDDGNSAMDSSSVGGDGFYDRRTRRRVAGGDADLAAMVDRLPSSPADLFKRIERQRDEMRLLQEENVRLRAREVEVSALTVRLQQQFAATQGQVDSIKSQIHLQLANPVTEEEYSSIDAMPEDRRDLLDTIKLGIYRQLGSMRASMQTATRRASELAATNSQLAEEGRQLKMELAEARATLERERDARGTQAKAGDKQTATIVELEATVRDLEAKLRNSFIDREEFMTAKLTAQGKTDEAARLALRLEEAEMDVQRYRTSAECNEQKLDILKSEYYELKLGYTQRILELESCLKAADEKLKTLGDLELESELFITSLAKRGDAADDAVGYSAVALSGGGASPNERYETYLALPRSRKLAHSLVAAKRCLHLENKVLSLEHDLAYKDQQVTRLQVSLEAARSALRNINSPYAMVEKTIDDLHAENERQKNKIALLTDENKELRERASDREADIKVLCKHRRELLKMKKLLKRLGFGDGSLANAYSGGDGDDNSSDEDDDHDDGKYRSGGSKSRRRGGDVSRKGGAPSASRQKSSAGAAYQTAEEETAAASSPQQQPASSSSRRLRADSGAVSMPGIEISF